MGLKTILAGCLWCLAALPVCALYPTITAVTPRAVPYILDYDINITPARDYHLLKGSVSVSFAGPSSQSQTHVRLTLLDDDNQVVPVVANTDVSPGLVVPVVMQGQTEQVTYTFAIDPDQRLDHTRLYRVRAQIEVWVNMNGNYFWQPVGTPLESAANRYYHFTNTADGDAAHNVIAEVQSVQITRNWRIQGVPDEKRFVGTAMVRLLRYDDPDSPVREDLLDFDLRLALASDLEQTIDITVPAQGVHAFSEQMPLRAAGNVPYETVKTIGFSFEAGSQLDPVNRVYQLMGSVWAEPAPGQAKARLSGGASFPTTMLDFNGKLRFGSVGSLFAVMTDAERTVDPYLPQAGYVEVVLDIASCTAGSGQATFTGSPGLQTVRLMPDGTAQYAGWSTLTLENPAGNQPQEVNYHGITFKVGSPITLTEWGASAAVEILTLPAGMGLSYGSEPPGPGTILTSALPPVEGATLDENLAPSGGMVNWSFFPDTRWVVEESKPVAVAVTGITWYPDEGRFALETTGEVHHPETSMRQALATAPSNVPDRERRSNNDYWLMANSVVTYSPCSIRQDPDDPDHNSNAVMTAEFVLDAGTIKSHFPEADLTVAANYNRIQLQDDLISTAESFLEEVEISLSYLAGDPDAEAGACGGAGVITTTVNLQPTNGMGRVNFTPNGGLEAVCLVAGGGHALKWGYIGSGQYAFATDAFQTMTFYMPGSFYPQSKLSTGGSDLAHQNTPGSLLLAGHVSGMWRFADMEEPGSAAYLGNIMRADYAGLNARSESEVSGFQGHSIIAGQNAGSYPLNTASRYYARKSGVTGIHDAFGGPSEAMLYGFDATFTSYGLSFRDCRVVESVTNGGLAVPYPSEFAVPLESIRFSSTGRPLDAKLPDTMGQVTLKYWNCKMTPTALAFSSSDPCDESAGLLRVQAGIEMPNLGQTLYGELGFHSNGEIATALDGIEGLSSRLKAPNTLDIRGPARADGTTFETYHLTPVTDVYLNNYHDYQADTPKGFLNLAGKLDVAFFEDLEVHIQTTVGTAGQEGTAPVYLTGGWTDAGKTFFNDPAAFDPGNRGFPQGVSLSAYRTGGDYQTVARRTWMDGIEFEIPLKWDDTTRLFSTGDGFDGTVDLMVLDAHYALTKLTAEQACLDFGVQYSGIPKIELGNLLVEALDEGTSALDAIETAIGRAVGGALLAGSDAVSGLLNDSFDELFGPVIEEEFRDLVAAQVLDPLSDSSDELKPQGQWQTILETNLTEPSALFQQALRKLGSDGANETALIGEIDDAIGEMIDALDIFILEAPDDDDDGLLAVDQNGNYKFASKLVFALIDLVADDETKTLLGIRPGTPAELSLNAQTTRYVNQYAPQLNTVKLRLAQIKEHLVSVRSRLGIGSELTKFINARFDSGSAELEAMGELLVNDIMAHLETRYGGCPEAFAVQSNRDATAAFIIRRIRDHMAAGAIAASLQTLLREQLQDLQAAIDQSVGSMFSSFNAIIRDLIKEVASVLDEAVAPLNGALAEIAGAGAVEGSAVIRGDRLDSLHLDAELKLELDEPVSFKGSLDITQLEVGGPYGNAKEIKVNAANVPIGLLGASANFNLDARIILDDDTYAPVAIGGGIEMCGGELNFEGFKITSLAAMLMFGIDDNYLAAKLGMEFQSFAVTGGLFIGHSNTLEPLAAIDPMVADTIPDGSITGVYVYGEVFMPIVDLTCMLRLSAGLGIGMFYFTEGPTYGGKIFAAVEGEALCALTIRGEVVLVGTKSDIMRFKGNGRLSGTVGWCPFCLKFNETVSFTYDENNGFDADY